MRRSNLFYDRRYDDAELDESLTTRDDEYVGAGRRGSGRILDSFSNFDYDVTVDY